MLQPLFLQSPRIRLAWAAYGPFTPMVSQFLSVSLSFSVSISLSMFLYLSLPPKFYFVYMKQ